MTSHTNKCDGTRTPDLEGIANFNRFDSNFDPERQNVVTDKNI
jgi:hypothetical protein